MKGPEQPKQSRKIKVESFTLPKNSYKATVIKTGNTGIKTDIQVSVTE